MYKINTVENDYKDLNLTVHRNDLRISNLTCLLQTSVATDEVGC